MNCRVRSGGKKEILSICTCFCLFIVVYNTKILFESLKVKNYICNVPKIMLVIRDNQIAQVLFKLMCESFIYEFILLKMVKPWVMT